ncbi:MAG: 6-carboxytetrahydropterin synthase [Bacteroidales bacterium]|nr:6-carboxytetrahydropterin synthase [Bacteroidales bacterium]
MARIRVTKEFDFEMAHALWNYDGACRNIHGHSYKLYVTIVGEPISDSNHPKFGMVLDFKDLKHMIKGPVVDFLDHSLVVYRKAEGETLSTLCEMYEKVHVFDFQPTCENLVLYIVEKIQSLLSSDIDLHSVKLYETATSFGEWYADDNN